MSGASETSPSETSFPISGPGKVRCFISHAYADELLIARLLATFPGNVDPIIWPVRTISARRMVSDGIVRTILSCDMLIYLSGGKSSQSPWVAFERDYALRAGKRVFRFDAESRFSEDCSRPLDLRVFTVYGGADRDSVLKITRFLREKRSFSLFVRHEQELRPESWQSTVDRAAKDAIANDGVAVWFVSTRGLNSNSTHWYVSVLCNGDHLDRLLPVKLDTIDLRHVARVWDLPHGDRLEEAAFDLSVPSSPAMELLNFVSRLPMSINRNALDDLIVSIYRRIYDSKSSMGRALQETLKS